MRGKASGSIRRPEHILPGDGVSVDQMCLHNQDSSPRCLASLLVTAFGVVLHYVIM